MSADITAEEIREIRCSYGLSQRSFAALLGIGVASIVRYEQGSKPSKANANLIRAARYPEFMLECLQRDGDLLSESQRVNATQVVYAVVSLKSESDDAASAKQELLPGQLMNETYEFTLRQEILNEQAANLACELMEYMIAFGVGSNDESNPVSVMLRQLFKVKSSITEPGCDAPGYLDEIAGSLGFVSEYINTLNSVQNVA